MKTFEITLDIIDIDNIDTMIAAFVKNVYCVHYNIFDNSFTFLVREENISEINLNQTTETKGEIN